MSPYERAARWHLAHCPGVEFREILEAHLFHGHVISSPVRFVLGRQVCRDWPAERLLDPWDSDEQGDAWHVWLWAGTVKDWQSVVPWWLPWIGFHRGERMRWHKAPHAGFPVGK
jgi:hypothetical protein